MINVARLSLWITLTVMIIFGVYQPALAVGPYTPEMDVFTDMNSPDINFQHPDYNSYLQLSASNYDSNCVASTYLWFKFLIPDTTSTVDYVELALPMDYHDPGTENLPLELWTSTDTSWEDTELRWDNQPLLDTTRGILGTSPSAAYPSDALFTSIGNPALASFLNGKKGQFVTFVVKANCAYPGEPIPFITDRLVASIDNTDPVALDVQLILKSGGPTSLSLVGIEARNQFDFPFVLIVIVTVLLISLVIFDKYWSQKE